MTIPNLTHEQRLALAELLNNKDVRVIQNEMAKGSEFVDMTYLRTGSLKEDVTPESFLQLERDTLERGGYVFDFKRGV